jgi:hypothetical protein
VIERIPEISSTEAAPAPKHAAVPGTPWPLPCIPSDTRIFSIDPAQPGGDKGVLVEGIMRPDGSMVIVGVYESCYEAETVTLKPGEYYEV